MTYKPNPDPSVPTMLSFLWLGVAMVGYIAGGMIQRFSWAFQLVCILSVVVSLYLLLRWRMTWFVYAVRPREDHTPVWEDAEPALAGGASLRYVPADRLDFIVVKGQGARNGVMECVLGMDDLVQASVVCRKNGGAHPKYDRKALLAEYPGAKVYEYIQTYRWEAAVTAIFRDGEGYAVLLLDLPEESEMGRYLLGINKI
ncbi:MAG: hypothetical protein IKY52_05450 [Clostridia bacterium]|nr:hypothetical protein [Clostridia bacterium]